MGLADRKKTGQARAPPLEHTHSPSEDCTGRSPTRLSPCLYHLGPPPAALEADTIHPPTPLRHGILPKEAACAPSGDLVIMGTPPRCAPIGAQTLTRLQVVAPHTYSQVRGLQGPALTILQYPPDYNIEADI